MYILVPLRGQHHLLLTIFGMGFLLEQTQVMFVYHEYFTCGGQHAEVLSQAICQS